MADIADELNAISTSIYGREMRGAIHDAIKKVNDDTEDIHTEFTQINQAVTDIREDNENINNELTQLENILLTEDTTGAGFLSLSGHTSVNKVYTENLREVTAEGYMYAFGFSIHAGETYYIECICSTSVPTVLTVKNGVLIRALTLGADNEELDIPDDPATEGYGTAGSFMVNADEDGGVMYVNSKSQALLRIYKAGTQKLTVYTKAETDAAIANAITNVINTAY